MDPVTTELFTVEEVAARFRVRPRTVYRWLRAGRMESIRTPGGQYRIPGQAVFRELESRVIEDPEV